jgi:MFS transporter, FSR family, fosmidomycin resistance protein
MYSEEGHRKRTLWLCGVLHGFTHLYHVALLPLYLLIQEDLDLSSLEQAPLLVTVLMLSYYLPSYPMGMLADRFSRKRLLGFGLLVNGAGFVGLALAPNYPMALASMVVAGIGGSFYHPAATALIARMFPIGTGKAFGLVGIGAGAGFFFSPIYTGWRAAMTGSWRAPVLELGLLGMAAALLFFWLAHEEEQRVAVLRRDKRPEKMFASPVLWLFFLGACLAFSMRDFTGSSMGSLTSLFLQKAHQYDLAFTGVALSGIFLAAMVSNPLFGRLSDRGRIRWIAIALAASGLLVALFPRVPAWGILPLLVIYGFFFMASFPMVEAALMESAPDGVRGRVFGFFITVGGLVGNMAHWLAGYWVGNLGAGAGDPESYYRLYALLAVLVFISLAGLPCLHALRKRGKEMEEQAALEAGPGRMA